MKKINKRGISLIVLIITILVVIILAAAVILTLSKNNPIESAQQAKVKSDVSGFKEELMISHANNLAEDKRYKRENVNILVEDTNYNEKMKEYIPSITNQYLGKLYIKNGELTYVNSDSSLYDEQEYGWMKDLGIKKYETAGAIKVASNPSKYYGMKVNNYISNGISEWKIFYSDRNNVYLISTDYIDVDKLPLKDGAKPIQVNTTSFSKVVKFEDVLLKYRGSSDITDQKLKELNYDYFITNKYTSTNNNMKAVAYMLDTQIWDIFSEGVGAEYAIGGPSVEMYFKSYCDKYPDKNFKAQATSDVGYQISKDGGTNFSNYIYTMISSRDTLYISNDSGAYQMFFASPSMIGSNWLVSAWNDGGRISGSNFQDNLSSAGFRPVVCLNSEVILKEENGEIKIEIDN